MGEDGGLRKLTEYLNQTRRQAEIAIDTLNAKLFELEEANKMLSTANDELTVENEYYKNLVEQLKVEGTRKSRLQERDDWKALVDSIQTDRVRLQEKNITLAQQLEDAEKEIERLCSVIDVIQTRGAGASVTAADLISSDTENEPRRTEADQVVQPSVINPSPIQTTLSVDTSTPNAFSPRFGSPSHDVVQRLRFELESLKEQRIIDEQMSKSEIACLKEEIARLQTESCTHVNAVSGNEAISARNSRTVGQLSSTQRDAISENNKELNPSKSTAQWSFWDYIFSPSAPVFDNNSKVFRV